ncbi:histidine phosphatase family protein [Candidatus Parcubacteria bacterium]|nr:histidine phosphatase family protein [Candidatus Parcubacteria bacterium]
MKWPAWLMMIRHDTSAYNVLRDKKKSDPLYMKFLEHWERNPDSRETRRLARAVQNKFALGVGDAETDLADAEGRQAFETGRALSRGELPDIVFVSPYKRALLTLDHIQRGWPALADVKTVEEERVREQEHGLALIYNDWRVFHALHPDQRRLRDMEGAYWYRYPQGENVPDVRERNRSFLATVTRDFAAMKVLVVTHHLNILACRANLERLGADDFIRLDEHEKPINCGVTLYRGCPTEGRDGRLKLEYYNHKHYT